MANRLHGFEIAKPLPNIPPPTTPKLLPATAPSSSTATAESDAWLATTARPLSDIRELTEPSLIDAVAFRKSANRLQHKRSSSRSSSAAHDRCLRRKDSANIAEARSRNVAISTENAASSSYSSTPEPSNFYAIPHSSVPRRSSSQNRTRAPSAEPPRKPSIRFVPPAAAPRYGEHTVPHMGHSRSPVKESGSRLDSVTADRTRNVPLQTRVRQPLPYDALEYPHYKHPRVKLDIQASAPLFVGGGTVEGFVRVTVDDNERMKQRRSLGISAISVDLIGYEELAGTRRAIFLALGTDLIDAKHPPPSNMVEPANPLAVGDRFWTLSPSTSMLPFVIMLPLDTGPPSFHSKQASIHFVLCTTALIRDACKHYRVRTSHEVHVLPTYDPEKALTSLPSPLTASDELSLPRAGSNEIIKITAGLHRQVWVSGTSIFVDVHISNRSRKPIKRLDLGLECNVLCYKHTAATTREKSAGQARIFENKHQTLLGMSSLKAGLNGWSGVEPYTSQTRTCDLELPRGHATVRCGKYFEVRYFLNVTISVSNTKLVSVQLPIILIHMNSLDVVPNSVAQVAAAIEEKRENQTRQYHQHRRRRTPETTPSARTLPTRHRSVSSPRARATDRDLRRQPSYTQGRAFAAPRQQSLERQRADQATMNELQHALDSSPRKYQRQPPPPSPLRGFALKKMGSNISFGKLRLDGTSASSTPGQTAIFREMAYRTPERQRDKENQSHSLQLHHHPIPHNTVDTSTDKPNPSKPLCLRDRLRRIRSLDSFQLSKGPMTKAPALPPPPPPIPIPPAHAFSISRPQHTLLTPVARKRSNPPPLSTLHILAPHTLGLSAQEHLPNDSRLGYSTTSSGRQRQGGNAGGTSSSASSRERMDRSRFEFKAVRRKGSQGHSGGEGGGRVGGIGERVRWKEREESVPEREGWI